MSDKLTELLYAFGLEYVRGTCAGVAVASDEVRAYVASIESDSDATISGLLDQLARVRARHRDARSCLGEPREVLIKRAESAERERDAAIERAETSEVDCCAMSAAHEAALGIAEDWQMRASEWKDRAETAERERAQFEAQTLRLFGELGELSAQLEREREGRHNTIVSFGADVDSYRRRCNAAEWRAEVAERERDYLAGYADDLRCIDRVLDQYDAPHDSEEAVSLSPTRIRLLAEQRDTLRARAETAERELASLRNALADATGIKYEADGIAPAPGPDADMVRYAAESVRLAREYHEAMGRAEQLERERDGLAGLAAQLHEHLDLILGYFREETSEGDGIREEHWDGYVAAKRLAEHASEFAPAWESASLRVHLLESRARLWKRAARTIRERAQQAARIAKDTEWELTLRMSKAVCDAETLSGLLRSECKHTANLTEQLAAVERERDELRARLERWEKAERMQCVNFADFRLTGEWARVPEDE